MIFDRDERKEIFRLLKELSPQQRIAWLQWCCSLIPDKGFAQTKVVQSSGEVNDVFWDFMSLKAMFSIDVETAGTRLTQMVRKGG